MYKTDLHSSISIRKEGLDRAWLGVMHLIFAFGWLKILKFWCELIPISHAKFQDSIDYNCKIAFQMQLHPPKYGLK